VNKIWFVGECKVQSEYKGNLQFLISISMKIRKLSTILKEEDWILLVETLNIA